MAHQGTAAFNIKGTTLCSSLHLPSHGGKQGFNNQYIPLFAQKNGPAQLKALQTRYKDVHLVVIDEHSVISCGMLHWIDQRMREIWPLFRDVPFGGRDVIFAGDSGQLAPVCPTALSVALRKIFPKTERSGRETWEAMEFVCNLESQNRGKSDPEYFDALRRLREKAPTQADLDLFNTRVLDKSSPPEWMYEAQHVAYRNADVDEANQQSIRQQKKKILAIQAEHQVHPKGLKDNRSIPESTVEILLREATKPTAGRDRIIRPYLELAHGAPVTLSFNIEQNAGLCNGSKGVVYDFMPVEGSSVPIVLVQMTGKYLGPSFIKGVPAIVPIVPRKVAWSPNRHSNLRITRTGLPLRLAYAMTIHKVQGLTCKKVVFHSEHFPGSSFAYVALSRVTNRLDLVLTTKLELKSLTSSDAVRSEFLEESDRVKRKAAQCKLDTQDTVRRMQLVAQAHNAQFLPR